MTKRPIASARLKTLDEREVIKAAQTLANRVGERFPQRGITREANEIAGYAAAFASEARSLSRRSTISDIAIGILTVFGFGATIFVLARIPWIEIEFSQRQEFFQAMQGLSGAIHIAVSVGLVILFVASRETRRKRKTALAGLSSLRNYAHVIDIHQLSKDPAAIAANMPRTRSSPDRDLTPQELLRYLDYCSEMLSIIAKFAALYAQNSRDVAIIEAVNDVELLTGSLSNKIWQKIMILHQGLPSQPPTEQP